MARDEPPGGGGTSQPNIQPGQTSSVGGGGAAPAEEKKPKVTKRITRLKTGETIETTTTTTSAGTQTTSLRFGSGGEPAGEPVVQYREAGTGRVTGGVVPPEGPTRRAIERELSRRTAVPVKREATTSVSELAYGVRPGGPPTIGPPRVTPIDTSEELASITTTRPSVSRLKRRYKGYYEEFKYKGAEYLRGAFGQEGPPAFLEKKPRVFVSKKGVRVEGGAMIPGARVLQKVTGTGDIVSGVVGKPLTRKEGELVYMVSPGKRQIIATTYDIYGKPTGKEFISAGPIETRVEGDVTYTLTPKFEVGKMVGEAFAKGYGVEEGTKGTRITIPIERQYFTPIHIGKAKRTPMEVLESGELVPAKPKRVPYEQQFLDWTGGVEAKVSAVPGVSKVKDILAPQTVAKWDVSGAFKEGMRRQAGTYLYTGKAAIKGIAGVNIGFADVAIKSPALISPAYIVPQVRKKGLRAFDPFTAVTYKAEGPYALTEKIGYFGGKIVGLGLTTRALGRAGEVGSRLEWQKRLGAKGLWKGVGKDVWEQPTLKDDVLKKRGFGEAVQRKWVTHKQYVELRPTKAFQEQYPIGERGAEQFEVGKLQQWRVTRGRGITSYNIEEFPYGARAKILPEAKGYRITGDLWIRKGGVEQQFPINEFIKPVGKPVSTLYKPTADISFEPGEAYTLPPEFGRKGTLTYQAFKGEAGTFQQYSLQTGDTFFPKEISFFRPTPAPTPSGAFTVFTPSGKTSNVLSDLSKIYGPTGTLGKPTVSGITETSLITTQRTIPSPTISYRPITKPELPYHKLGFAYVDVPGLAPTTRPSRDVAGGMQIIKPGELKLGREVRVSPTFRIDTIVDSKIDQREKPIIGPRLRGGFMFGERERVGVTPITDQFISPVQEQRQMQAQVQFEEQIQDTSQIQIQRMITPTFRPSARPTTDIFTPTGFIIPPLGFGAGRGRGAFGVRYKRATRYTPSLRGLWSGVTIGKAPKGVLTGLEPRYPIAPKRKVRKKKRQKVPKARKRKAKPKRKGRKQPTLKSVLGRWG